MAFDASAARLIDDFNFDDPFEVVDGLKTPASASMSGIGSLAEYLQSAPLESSLNLDSAGKLYFHWANWSRTCQMQRELHAGNPARLDALEKSLASLKRIEIWLKSPKGTIVTTLHELYESYLDPRLRGSLFSHGLIHSLHEREILFSDAGEAGPFSRLSSMKWFDKNIYACFVFRKMLLGFVPERAFRLGTTIETAWWLRGSPLEAMNVIAHQISGRGVLFKVKTRGEFARLVHGCEDNVLVHFPLALLRPCTKPQDTLAALEKGDTIALRLDGKLLKERGVWNRGGGHEESYFFIPSEILLNDRAHELEKTWQSFEKWFTEGVK